MDNCNFDADEDATGQVCSTADWDSSPFPCQEKEQLSLASFTASEDPSSKGAWSQRSQRSISRSLQRAEVLLRSTFHPSLKWLFRSHSQDEEEGHFVTAHNLVSRSSTRLLRLQQVLLAVAPPGQQAGEAQAGSSQGHCRALWKLLMQRSLLLLTHEYTRRVHLAAAYVSRLDRLLEQLQKSPPTPTQTSSMGSNLCSLCQELRVHLNHWFCLFSKVQSDPCLRLTLVHYTGLLLEIQRKLDSLALQALVLMDRCVYLVLSAVAQMDLDSVPSKVLEDILSGTDLYNQAVEEQRQQQSAFQLRTSVLQQAGHRTSASRLTKTQILHPAAFSIHELLWILAVRHAEAAAKQLHGWASEQSRHSCHRAEVCRLEVGHRSEMTWEQPASLSLLSQPHPLRLPDPHLDCDTSQKCPVSVQQMEGDTCLLDTCQSQLSSSNVEVQHSSQQQGKSSTSAPHPQLCRGDHVSVDVLLHLLLSSNDWLSRRCSPEGPGPAECRGKADAVTSDSVLINTPDLVDLTRVSSTLNKDENVERGKQEGVETELDSSCSQDPGGAGPHSVQWFDLGQPLVLTDLMDQYGSLFRSLCSEALRLQLFIPPAGGSADSINLQDVHRAFHTLSSIRQVLHTDQLSEECKAILEDFSEYLLVITAHTHWDHVLCRSLGYALKDKCVRDQSRTVQMCPSEQDGAESTSVTMEHFLSLPAPLHSALSCCQSDGPGGSALCSAALRRSTIHLLLASVQLSTVWVMSKAHQFLSSWSLNKFLLVTQGDLKMLRKSLQQLVHQTKSLVVAADGDHCSSLEKHNQLLLRLQLGELDTSVSELQTFSSRVLKSFSSDCKRMSGEIFERTMPSAVHWRPGHRTGFPNSPSEYASLAAQTVVGQVLEGVAPLSDDVRVQALSITMTAFMEAWMEHILKQKIKFSVQGALQLKQDFDCIREMIQADRYGLSADLHQRLLSLRVFQQVDSAVVCLLQQPQAKSYVLSRAWEPLTHCCPSNGSRDGLDAAVSSSITNLHCVEGAELPANLPAVAPSTPAEPYLAPSVPLGAAQQQWLDLRIQNNTRRWRLPGIQCLSTYES
ncbi:unnamed protein product [Ophioblennius macclurei]